MMGIGNQPTATSTGGKTSSSAARTFLANLGMDQNAIENAIAKGVIQGIFSAKKGGSVRSIKLPSHITDRFKNKVRH